MITNQNNLEESERTVGLLDMLKEYNTKIVAELMKISEEVCTLILESLLPHENAENDAHGTVFYNKMLGDYYRYLCEVCADKPETLKNVKEKAEEYYAAAREEGKRLAKTDPILLGLALNHSVFEYEIMENAKVACELAKDAFDQAIHELDSLPEADYQDSTLIMQLLRDNLTLWTSDDMEQPEATAE